MIDHTKQSVRLMSEDELSAVIKSVLAADHRRDTWRSIESIVIALIGGLAVLIAAMVL